MPHLTSQDSHLISAQELSERLSSQQKTILLDIRFRPNLPDGRPDYRAGHIPGAIYVDLPTELAGESHGFSGRRPLPEVRDLQRDARRWGIHPGDTVVVYDNNRGLQAARAWWVLRWAGIPSVRLLDGGFGAWSAQGLPVTTDIPLPDYGDVVLEGGHLPVIDADESAALARSSILFDARSFEQYVGEAEGPSGHIPGALLFPASSNLTAEGLLSSPHQIREKLAHFGVRDSQPIGFYCGGGVAAAFQILALATAGIEASLFPGSWSAWSSDPNRPIARGSEPG